MNVVASSEDKNFSYAPAQELRAVALDHRLLHRVQRAVVLPQSLDREHGLAIQLRQQADACVDGAPVESRAAGFGNDDRAGPAVALRAALLGAGEASMLSQLCKLMGKDEATQKAAAFDELAHTLSQLLHGERAALQLCGQLTTACTTMDEKWYAASQVTDEARHLEAISKFLTRKIGTIHPINPTLKPEGATDNRTPLPQASSIARFTA